MRTRLLVQLVSVCAVGGGASLGGAAAPAFEKVALPTTAGRQYTTVTMGPDGHLYATANNGEIRRWFVFNDGTLGPAEIITSLRDTEGGDRLLIGLVFDPSATARALVAWVTHATYGFTGMPDWGGKVSRLSGESLGTVEDYVVGLPRSSNDHVTNGISFGPDGAIYFVQGSNSSHGAPDPVWANRAERLLTACVLRLDRALVAPPVDVRTDEGGTYDPYAPSAPLTIHASGTRNAYDLVWHTNGQLYVPVNGGNVGNAPPGVAGAPCGNGTTYGGPAVPPVAIGTLPDYLFRVEQGGYFGHPNPTRCEFVADGGNPTSGPDPGEVAAYPIGTSPDANYRGVAYDFGLHRSPDGIIEYRSAHFDGALEGALMVVRYSAGDDVLVMTPGGDELDIVATVSSIPGLSGFLDPLDLVEDRRNGNLYVSEYAASKITLVRPIGVMLCAADLDRSGDVGFGDLTLVLLSWGPCAALTTCREDLDGTRDVGFGV